MNLTEARKKMGAAASGLKTLQTHEGVCFEEHDISKEFPVPVLLYFGFKKILRFKEASLRDKMRWGFAAKLNAIPFYVEQRKWGLQILIPKDSTQEEMRKVKKILRSVACISAEYLRRLAESQIKKGNVTVPNRYPALLGAYKFFRTKADAAFSEPSNYITPWTAAGYYAHAMLDAYFSWLEHVLILVLPFTSFDPTMRSISELAKSKWDTKFKEIFEVSKDNEAMKILSQHKLIKEQYRNPWSHGGLEKDASFFFHVEGVGAVPVRLMKHRLSFHLWDPFISKAEYPAVCAALDRFYDFLISSKIRYGLLFAERGFNPCFDAGSRKLYSGAMNSDKEFDAFLEDLADKYERHFNMD